MIIDTRILSSNKILNFERLENGQIVGKLIRLDPPGESAGGLLDAAMGVYREYRTPVSQSLSEAESEMHAIIERLREADPDF